MPLSLKSVARGVLGAIPLSFYPLIIRRDVVVFLYHLVGPPDLAHVRHIYSYKSPKAFERDLLYLALRFRMVSYDEIVSKRNRSGRQAAHITFDDGYAECDTLARPILLQRGVPDRKSTRLNSSHTVISYAVFCLKKKKQTKKK